MERRDFIKSVGAVGMFSLLSMIPLYGSTSQAGGEAEPADNDRTAKTKKGFEGPFDLAFDSSGNLLVTDPPGYRVLVLDPANRPKPLFGMPGAQPGRLNFPKGIAVDRDDLIYVVDSNNCRVQVFARDGSVKQVIGSIGSIGGSFSTPQGVFLDVTGKLFVADTRNHRIQIFEQGNLVAVLGDLGDGKDQFRLPTACVVTPDQEVLVLDSKHGLVKVFGQDLTFRRSFGGVGSGPGLLNMPQGMELDTDGNVWVADTGNHRIQEFGPDGKLISAVGKMGSGPGEFENPTGVACRDNNVYVADNGNRRIQVLARNRG